MSYKELILKREQMFFSRGTEAKSRLPQVVAKAFSEQLLRTVINLDSIVASKIDEVYWNMARFDYMSSILDVENRLDGIDDISNVINSNFLGDSLDGDGEIFSDGIWVAYLEKYVRKESVDCDENKCFNFSSYVIDVPFIANESLLYSDWQDSNYDLGNNRIIYEVAELTFPYVFSIDIRLMGILGWNEEKIFNSVLLQDLRSGNITLANFLKYLGAFIVMAREFRNSFSLNLWKYLIRIGSYIYRKVDVVVDIDGPDESSIQNKWLIHLHSSDNDLRELVELFSARLLPYNVLYEVELLGGV